MISELKIVTIGVSELERSISFYRDSFAYEVIGIGNFDGGNLGSDKEKFAVIGVPSIESGMMRLIEYGPDAKQVWGGYERPGDHGLYAINFRVPNMESAWPRIAEAGAVARSEPHFWKVSDELSVHDCMCFDPDGTLLDVFEMIITGPSKYGPLTLPASEVQNVVVHTEDADTCRDFYCGFGYTANQDKTLEGLEEFLKLPKGTAIRNLNLAMNHLSPNGRIEISQYVGVEGRRLNASAPALGIISASFQSDDFENDCALLEKIGAVPLVEAHVTRIPPYGDVRIAAFEGPDGERLELFG